MTIEETGLLGALSQTTGELLQNLADHDGERIHDGLWKAMERGARPLKPER